MKSADDRSKRETRQREACPKEASRPHWTPPTLFYVLLGPISAILGILALPGFDLWILAFVAWVPLLIAVSRLRLRWALTTAFLTGLRYFLGSLYWLTLVSVLGWVLLSIYLGLLFVLFALLCRWSTTGHPRVPFVLAAPVTWVAVEFLRSETWAGPDWFLFTGFPWNLAAHPLYRTPLLIQVADFSGVYGVSFVVLTVNAWLAGLVCAVLSPETNVRRKRLGYLLSVSYVALLLAGVMVYGAFRLREYAPVEGPRVCVIQGNIPQDLKEIAATSMLDANERYQESERIRDNMLETYLRLTREAVDGPPCDILVWPETTLPGPIELTPDSYLALLELRQLSGSHVLVGTTRLDEDPQSGLHYNSAFFYDSTGSRPPVIYDKLHPVPFGEYIPLQKTFPWLKRLMPPGYMANVKPGRGAVVFSLPKSGEDASWHFATPICFEDTMPYLLRESRRHGADFVINLTNDGWFGSTYELDQHLGISVFGAVQNRLGLVRAANTGISGFIEPSGRISSILTDGSGKARRVEGILGSVVMVDRRQSPYVRHGEIVAVLCLGWTTAFLVLRTARIWTPGEVKN